MPLLDQVRDHLGHVLETPMDHLRRRALEFVQQRLELCARHLDTTFFHGASDCSRKCMCVREPWWSTGDLSVQTHLLLLVSKQIH